MLLGTGRWGIKTHTLSPVLRKCASVLLSQVRLPVSLHVQLHRVSLDRFCGTTQLPSATPRLHRGPAVQLPPRRPGSLASLCPCPVPPGQSRPIPWTTQLPAPPPRLHRVPAALVNLSPTSRQEASETLPLKRSETLPLETTRTLPAALVPKLTRATPRSGELRRATPRSVSARKRARLVDRRRNLTIHQVVTAPGQR